MTKKQFDIETKRNLGDDIGGHTRSPYRLRRMRDGFGGLDLLAARMRHGTPNGATIHKSRARALISRGYPILPGLAPVSCAGGQGLA